MKILTRISFGALAIAALSLSSCASTYKPLNPSSAPFTFTEKTNGLVYSYQYDMLQLKGNKKYAKREPKNQLRVVAVKVTNTTDSTLHIGKDYKFLMGNSETAPIPPVVAAQQLKQGVPIYLLYLLLNFQSTTVVNGVVEKGPFIPTGPPIAALNMLIAADANSKFRKELVTQNITDKSVAPGETIYGLMTLHTVSAAPLRLERRNPILNAQIKE